MPKHSALKRFVAMIRQKNNGPATPGTRLFGAVTATQHALVKRILAEPAE